MYQVQQGWVQAMKPNYLAPIVILMLIAGAAWCMWQGAMAEAERGDGYRMVALFIAIGVSQARLACDGEAVTVAAHMDSTGTVEICAVACDSIGPWPEGEWCVASECHAERGE